MKIKFCTLNIFCISLLVLFTAGTTIAGTYKIGAGDVLNIAVWKNPDLSGQMVTLPDGTIHFPLIGELEVEGLSASELEEKLKTLVGKYMTDPVITVSIQQVNSMMIYVIGKVNNPGRFMLQDDIDVLQALSLAGGLNPFAKEKDIKIFRKEKNKTSIFSFNYQDVSEGEDLEQNITLNRGDVIVVR